MIFTITRDEGVGVRKQMTTQELYQRIAQLMNQGLSDQEVADAVSTSPSQLIAVIRRLMEVR